MLQTDVHFIYPVFAYTKSRIVYGHYFIPLLDPPGAFYVTGKNQHEASEIIFKALDDLWPLLVIGLLLAIFAGFCAWLMETWNNEKEFPRPFLRGWFEGEIYVLHYNESFLLQNLQNYPFRSSLNIWRKIQIFDLSLHGISWDFDNVLFLPFVFSVIYVL